MKYLEYTSLLSKARMSKYIKACNGNKAQAINLYHYNIKLSERMFGVISMFEIILRNAIDKHYSSYFSDSDWLVNQAHTGKMLGERAKDIQAKAAELKKSGTYSPERMVSSFMMGFWTFMFTRRHYNDGGKTLLKIFPLKPKGTTQKIVYDELGQIRELRNRIAHHEPICFDAAGNVSTAFACRHYELILKYLSAMGLNTDSVLYRIETPDATISQIDKLFSA